MPRQNVPAAPVRYGALAVALHWLLALALLGNFCLGVYMADLPLVPLRLRLFNWHKWAGICILAASFVRLAWRLWRPPPPELPMPPWQRRAAHAVHAAMYLLFFAVPLAGWAHSSATGFQVVVFGVLPLPDFVPRSKPLADVLESTHAALAWSLAALVIVHVVGALKHQWIDGDRLLERMSLRPAPGPGSAPAPRISEGPS